ncbi:MAG: hypothetical protein JOZ33_12930 [Acidobacteriaceae bacterium]|nr:hypothetical protein [Acidobacteriaceae bacterium]
MSGGYNILENFDITGSDANGVILATTGTTASYNQAIGNYVHDIVTPCDDDGGTALGSGGGTNYTGISHDDFIGNLIVNVTNAAGSACPENTSAGIYESVPYGVVANNIVINVSDAIQSWHAAAHLTFFGNTEINSRIGIIVGAGDAPGGTNDYTVVQNNIAVNSKTGIQEENNTGTHNQYIDNLGYENDTDVILQNGLTCSGCLYDADPLFINNTGDATGNYCVYSNSPALGTGLARAGILTDFYGNSRPQSGATAVGACIVPSSSSGSGSSGGSSSNVSAGISASATTIAPGQGVRLTWTSQNAASVQINGINVALNGSGVWYPTTTTPYRITAYSSTGAMYAATLTVSVVNASITASATTVAAGQGVRLTWATQSAATATLTGSGHVALNGSGVVYPTTTTTYTITGISSTGVTYTASVTITVVNASITASATTVAAGQGVRLTWATQNAATATLSGSGYVALNGSGVVYPATTTAYTITAISSTGVTYAAKVVVTVQ